MASSLRVPDPRKLCVKIRNPIPGGRDHTSLERARRFVEHKRAYFDGSGQLVFHGRNIGRTRGQVQVIDSRTARPDAFPERAVLPPSPEVMRRQGSRYMSVAEVMAMRRERNLAARTTVPI